MRDAFSSAIVEFSKFNKNIFVVAADISKPATVDFGIKFLKSFKKKPFPQPTSNILQSSFRP